MVRALQMPRSGVPGMGQKQEEPQEATSHLVWERGEGFAPALGGRAPAEIAELTSGDPRLPAEDEHSPPFLSLPLLLFPLPLPGL